MNGLLPVVMKELYTTNDQIHDYLQGNIILFILIKDVPIFTQDALVIQAREFGLIYRRKLMLMYPWLSSRIRLNYVSWNTTLK